MNKGIIHELLNEMWQTIERIAIRLDNKILDIELDNSHGNYLEIEDGWSEAFYANPCINFPFGELGYSLDGLYCVFSIDPQKIDAENLVKIITFSRENPDFFFELYGGDDCFETYLSSKDEGDLDDILKAVNNTKEEFIQFEIGMEAFAEDEIVDVFIDLSSKLYEFLSDSDLLALIPTNTSN